MLTERASGARGDSVAAATAADDEEEAGEGWLAGGYKSQRPRTLEGFIRRGSSAGALPGAMGVGVRSGTFSGFSVCLVYARYRLDCAFS